MRSALESLLKAALFLGLGLFMGLYRLPPSTDFDALIRKAEPTPVPAPLVPIRFYMQRLNLFKASSARADIVLLGDSLTEGGLWDEYLQRLPLLNRGISGDLSDGVLQRLLEVIDRKPNVVSLLIGANDLLAGFETSHTLGNIRQIVSNLHEAHIRTILHSVSFASPGYKPAINPGVDAINPGIRALAQETASDFLDLNALTALDGALDPSMTYDGLHFNPKGYLVWSQALRPKLEAARAQPLR